MSTNLTLKSCCPVCSSTEKLARCQACLVMPYCGREHQVAHRNEHKKACNAIKKAKQKLDTEERELRSLPADDWPGNVFENEVGRFWGILETRDYMRARFGYVDALLKIKTTHAVQLVYDNIWDMLRLCRGDNMGLRDLIPSILLRLGRDQECYDFVKWYADDRPDYDWGDMSLPFLDVKDADVFEPVKVFCKKYAATCHAIAVMLIKIRLLLELRNLKASEVVGSKLPREMLDSVQEQLLSHAIDINPKKKAILEKGEQYEGLINELKWQINDLHVAVGKGNKYFWPALLNPGKNLTAPMSAYSMGSKQEMQLYLQYSYDAWKETPGAIDIIQELEDEEFMEEEDECFVHDSEIPAWD